MSNTMLGLDIGTSTLKLAVVDHGHIQTLAEEQLPDHLVRDGRITSADVLAQELKAALRSHHITTKQCALVLPAGAVFTRRVTLPYMTTDQLRVNLPYEFHDYLQNDRDQYFFDYAVVNTHKDEAGKPVELELLIAAASKETVGDYRAMLRKAGLKLAIAVPEYLAYRNLIRSYEAREPDHPKEYCIVDMGYTAIRIHMYCGAVYETSRVVEYGGATLDSIIADAVAVDPHVAADYKRVNYEGVQDIPACQDLYTRMGVEILRAVNFYGFNYPNANLQDIYFGGGLAHVPSLMQEVRADLQLRTHGVEELLPPCASGEVLGLFPAAVGATLQSDGR